MAFKDTVPQFQLIDPGLIDADPAHPRQHFDEAALKALANSIRTQGLIHPLLVQPAAADGRYTLLVGERRRRAALLAGESRVPVLVRPCSADEALEVRVFENLGLGVRVGLEPREMANAIQAISQRFESTDAAAAFFGRSATWLAQATAAAKLSPKVAALLEAGKISGTGAALQLEKLAQKNEAKAESLIDHIEQLPDGERLARKVVDHVLSQEGGRRRKKDDEAAQAAAEVAASAVAAGTAASAAPVVAAPAAAAQASAAATTTYVPPWEELAAAAPAAAPASNRRLSPGKVKRVAEILGLSDGDEETVLATLIDQFLAMQAEARPAG